MRTLIDLFKTFAPRGERPAFVNRTGVRRLPVSYSKFSEQSLRTARLLVDRGVRPGDRVMIWGPSSSWWAVAYFGTILAGATAVPVDFMSGAERARTIHRLTDARLIFQSRFKIERLQDVSTILLEELGYLIEELPPAASIPEPAPEDTAQLIYTSGTTGNPKGVILTHANLVANMIQINEAVPIITSSFVFLSLLPLSHMFEQMGGFFTPLYRGASVIYLRTLKPSAIMEALSEEDVYVIMSVPRLMQLLRTSIEQGLEEKHLSAVASFLQARAQHLPLKARRFLFYPVQAKFGHNFTVFVSGGAPLDPDLFDFWSSLGFTLLEGYGLTECSPVLTVNRMDRQVRGSVGPPLPGIDLRIENQEVVARGDNVFPGYYQNEQATREAFTAEGWFRTGDLGELNQEGWLFIKGREKELIVTGAGINVYPDEIEGLLNRTPGVRESCVIGIDKGSGEEVHAVLLLEGGTASADQIVEAVNRRLDPLHQITSFTIWQEGEFPKTTTLKIQKFQVKEHVLKGREAGGGAAGQDKLIALLARLTGTAPAEIGDDSLLVRDLGLTSIARVELVSYLEQEYRLDIEDSRIGAETRVRDLRQMIAKRERVKTSGHFRFWTNSAPVRALRKAADLLFHYPLYRILADLEVRGAEQIENLEGPVFFVSNHLSYLDQPSIMFALPRRLRYHTASAAYEEFFFAPQPSLGMRLWKRFTYEYGTLLVNLFPLPQTRGFSGSMRFMGRLADNGVNILIFPEGQHSRSGELLPFQPGLGIMVKELDLPVVPVHIAGTAQILPADLGWPKRGKVSVTFGTPLRFRFEEPGEIVVKTRQAVEQLG